MCLPILTTIVSNGCATVPQTPEGRMNAALTRVDEQIERAIVSATDASKLEVYPNIYVRKNPSKGCKCPDYELFIYGHWHRVALTTNSKTSKMLDEATDGEMPISVEDMDRSQMFNGRLFPVFKIVPKD